MVPRLALLSLSDSGWSFGHHSSGKAVAGRCRAASHSLLVFYPVHRFSCTLPATMPQPSKRHHVVYSIKTGLSDLLICAWVTLLYKSWQIISQLNIVLQICIISASFPEKSTLATLAGSPIMSILLVVCIIFSAEFFAFLI